MRHRLVLAALALALPAAAARAQGTGSIQNPTGNEDISRVATRGASFLGLGAGARPLALAGANTGTAGDLSSLYWNVAGLADIQSPTGFASYEKLYGNSGLSNTFVGIGLPAFGGTFGVSLQSFSSGEMTRTTEAYPDGGDPTFGAIVEWTATSVGVHYARPFTDRLAFGATLKRAREGIEFSSATYYGGDVGVRFRSGLAGSTLGISVANLGSSGRMDGPAVRRRLVPSSDPALPTGRTLEIDLRPDALSLPTTIRIGVETDIIGSPEAIMRGAGPHRLAIFTDISDAVDTRLMPAIAGEYSFRNAVFFRAGGRYLNDDRPQQGNGISYTAGLGVQIPIAGRRFLLDYAWRNFGDLNDNHVFSFQFGS